MGFINLELGDNDSEQKTYNILKIVFIFVILGVTLFFGYFPLFG